MKELPVVKFLQSFQILTDTEINQFVQFLQPKTLKKNEFFIREGDTCQQVAFVVDGLLRSFHTNQKGDEMTYCINFPNTFMTAYSSFLTGQPTEENIQAITDTNILIFQKKSFEQESFQSANWIKFLKLMAELQYIELEKRFFQFQKHDAKQRYQDLLNNHPEYIQQIPLQYLASYVGMSQRHLSRIRKEIRF